MMASVGVGRKPLRIITHQENNSALPNKQIFTPISNGKKPLLSKKKSATLCSEEKRKARQANCSDREQSENKQGRGEAAEWVERQGQSRQNYFLRKTVMALYRLFERTQSRWNLDKLGYGHLLRIMQELGYLRAVKGGEDLKRCYWLWINLSQGRSFSLVNLLIVLFCLEQLECDPQLIADIVAELGKGIAKFELEDGGEDSGKFIFLVRNERFRMEEGVLRVGREEAEKIQRQLRELRLNKLMQGKYHDGRESEEEARPVAISKRSQQLAERRRQQMASEIRQKEPHV